MYARTECLGEGTALARGKSAQCAAVATGRGWHRSVCRVYACNASLRSNNSSLEDTLQAAINLVEPNKTCVRQNRHTVFNTINQRASFKQASLPDLSLQSKHSSQHSRAQSDYNNGATLTRAGMAHTHLFHRICKLARPMETPLCNMPYRPDTPIWMRIKMALPRYSSL